MKRLSKEVPDIFDYLEYEFDYDEGGLNTKVNKISDFDINMKKLILSWI